MGQPARKRDEADRLQAEADTIDDSIENLDRSPMQPLIMVPRPMAFGAAVVALIGTVIGAGVGALLALAIVGTDSMGPFFAVVAVLAVAGFVGGGVIGGWRGGQGAKARDEQRPSYAGRAPGTEPTRRGEHKPPGEPSGWE